MYLTAQRLTTLSGEMGINVLLHRHGGRDIPGMSWEKPDVEFVAEKVPGTVVAQNLEIPPGKNHVMSYLDVVASDSVEAPHISDVLDQAERLLEHQAPPLVRCLEGVGVRFSLEPGLEGYEDEEFKALKHASLQLLRSPIDQSWQACRPLTINVRVSDQEVRFALDSESTTRVLERHPTALPPKSITIEHEMRRDFERAHGDVIPHMILALTGLRLEDVIELGGVRLKEVPEGRIIREWPKRPSQ